MEAADEDVDGSESVAITKDFQEGARGAFVFVTALSCSCPRSLWSVDGLELAPRCKAFHHGLARNSLVAPNGGPQRTSSEKDDLTGR